MAREIERKFLVDVDSLPILEHGFIIKQAYIPTQDKTAVRVRIKDTKAYLTIKGENKGMSRLEFEYEIPLDDANEMINTLCSKPIISKIRYEIKIASHTWEIDVFEEENKGLIVAEVELLEEDEEVILPSWIKKEVTNESKYYNSNLVLKPFLQW
ncbi:MAG: CYTH domain-containing protein [Campylobacteraceae bacterium]|nr:CYTH domain-containing protein [Campylobacteraceae bacterium]